MRVHCVELCVGCGRCVGHESNASAGRGIRTATPWHKTCKPSVVSAGVVCPDRAGGRTRRATRCALDVRSCWLAIPRFHHVMCPCLSRVVSGVAASIGAVDCPTVDCYTTGKPKRSACPRLFSSTRRRYPFGTSVPRTQVRRYAGTLVRASAARAVRGSRLRLEYTRTHGHALHTGHAGVTAARRARPRRPRCPRRHGGAGPGGAARFGRASTRPEDRPQGPSPSRLRVASDCAAGRATKRDGAAPGPARRRSGPASAARPARLSGCRLRSQHDSYGAKVRNINLVS